MSNVKNVRIAGTIPFDLGDNPELIAMVGLINKPTSGLRLTYSEHDVSLVPNSHGGRTAMYGFRLTGAEAISFKALDEFCRLVKGLGGTIDLKTIVDLEG